MALRDTNALVLGTVGVGSGTLDVQAGGALTQTGAITQAAGAGTFTITATNAATDISLASQANDLSGTVAIGGTASNIRDFGLRNTNVGAAVPDFTGASNLRSLTLTFNGAAVALPTISLATGGNLSVTAGGAITQAAGGITVLGLRERVWVNFVMKSVGSLAGCGF